MMEDVSEMDGALQGAPHEAGQGAGPAADLGSDDQVGALQAEVSALKEQTLRLAAETENMRRRSEREANDARAYAIQKFARDLLDAADNLSRALAAAPKESADPAVKNLVLGIEMTEKALQTAFERNGLKRVEPVQGDRFDPNLHQAMMEQEVPDVAPGAVIQVLQTGYELFGRIVRPALVAVTPKGAAAKPAPAASPSAHDPYATDASTTGGSVDAKA